MEFALASMIFFVTLFGIIEFGLAVWHYNMLSNLAQEGARRASVCGARKVLAAGACDIDAYVRGRAAGPAISSVTVTPALSTLNIGDTVTVRVAASFAPLTGLVPHGTLNMSSTVKMIVVR